MPAAIPTFADQRWGPNTWCKFDYYQNPTRVSVDAKHPQGQNPVLFLRHPGGGTVGSHQWYRNSAQTDFFYFIQWLLGGACVGDPSGLQGAQAGTEPSRHWDILSFTSGQQTHDVTAINRSISLFSQAAVRDCQRGVASCKHLLVDYGGNPNRSSWLAESYGSTLMGVGQLKPPRLGSGNLRAWTDRIGDPNTHDSRLKGGIWISGPVDLRKLAGVEYFHYSRTTGIFGTHSDNGAEYSNLPADLKEAMSARAFIERGDTAYYSGFYMTFVQAGDHVNPFGDPNVVGSNLHDSRQLTDMTTALSNAGLPYGSKLLQPGEVVNTSWPVGPNPTALAIYQDYENYLANLIPAGGP
jgi:hypothetical protein